MNFSDIGFLLGGTCLGAGFLWLIWSLLRDSKVQKATYLMLVGISVLVGTMFIVIAMDIMPFIFEHPLIIGWLLFGFSCLMFFPLGLGMLASGDEIHPSTYGPFIFAIIIGHLGIALVKSSGMHGFVDYTFISLGAGSSLLVCVSLAGAIVARSWDINYDIAVVLGIVGYIVFSLVVTAALLLDPEYGIPEVAFALLTSAVTPCFVISYKRTKLAVEEYASVKPYLGFTLLVFTIYIVLIVLIFSKLDDMNSVKGAIITLLTMAEFPFVIAALMAGISSSTSKPSARPSPVKLRTNPSFVHIATSFSAKTVDIASFLLGLIYSSARVEPNASTVTQDHERTQSLPIALRRETISHNDDRAEWWSQTEQLSRENRRHGNQLFVLGAIVNLAISLITMSVAIILS